MSNSLIQVIGNVASDVRFNSTAEGIPVASFRLAATERKFDRSQSRWVDGDVNWYTVSCWRALGENVTESINKGDPIFVVGRLNVRNWEREERSGTTLDITAELIGHDLSRGTAKFQRGIKVVSEESSTYAA